MPLIHLGGEKCVTGSCHLLQVQNLNVLVDCGAAQGGDRCVPISQWPVKPAQVDFIFLTHAHADHIGLLPRLLREGFGGRVLCTHGTKALLEPMLKDAMQLEGLQEKEKEKIKRQIEEKAIGFEYDRSFDLERGIRFKLGRAGHILGSCFIRLKSAADGFAVLFSGDLGNCDTPLLPDPDTADPTDFLILESTYGDRLHGDRAHRMERLAAVLDRSLADGGKVFIPAFALGRTQEILYELDRIFTLPEYRARFPRFREAVRPPVFVDSPLGLEITAIYSRLAQYWDAEAAELLQKGDRPLDFKRLYGVEKHCEHEQLLGVAGPAVIIAGSGMCTGGRIVDHLAHGIEDPRNDVVFIGYMAQGTPGREIQQCTGRGGRVRLNGAERKVRAGVHVMSGYSAHADQAGLLAWVAGAGRAFGSIRLVHGSAEARAALKKKLAEQGYEGVEARV